ncbi:unnamed protein product [Allacma fusca]|uniref:Uncharacterized protein n=1 Tax=Allacma fusca TaxID=39272 RepID=A0A8J2L6V9_9HEXA|nr:unnamed protein product [Allacma fusca]
MDIESFAYPSTQETTETESQYFFFLAESKGNQYPASFIGEPIPVAKSVAQLFMSASPGRVSTPSQQRKLIPPNNDNGYEIKNSVQLPITSAELKAPGSSGNKNSIVSLMEALIKTPKPKNKDHFKASTRQDKDTTRIPEMCSQHSPAPESEALKTFLPFRPSEHMNIFGAPFTVPPVEVDMSVDGSKNESENEEESTSGFESDDEKLDIPINPSQQGCSTRKDSSGRLGNFVGESKAAGIASTGYAQKRTNATTCEHRKNCRQNVRSKDGSPNAYFNLARIFSRSRVRKRQKGKR